MISIDTVNKLISTMVSEPLGLDIEATISPKNKDANDEYLVIDIVVVFDSEKYNVASDNYDEQYVEIIWKIDDIIADSLKYLGDLIIIQKIEYIPKSTKFYNDVVKKLRNKLPEIQDRIDKEIGENKVTIKNFRIDLNENTYDATLVIILDNNTWQLQMSVWSIIREYINTDSFIPKFIVEKK